MDSGVAVHTLQSRELNETWYVDHIYIKDAGYEFRDDPHCAKAAFVWYAPARVGKVGHPSVLGEGPFS